MFCWGLARSYLDLVVSSLRHACEEALCSKLRVKSYKLRELPRFFGIFEGAMLNITSRNVKSGQIEKATRKTCA